MACVVTQGEHELNNDEIKNYITSRWITTSTWSVFEFPAQGRWPPVIRLVIHEENRQHVIFSKGEEEVA